MVQTCDMLTSPHPSLQIPASGQMSSLGPLPASGAISLIESFLSLYFLSCCLRLRGSPSPFLGILANVIPMGFWETTAFLASGTFCWLLPVLLPSLLHTSVQFPDPLYISFVSSHTWSCLPLSPWPFSLPPKSLLPSPSRDCFVPHSK